MLVMLEYDFDEIERRHVVLARVRANNRHSGVPQRPEVSVLENHFTAGRLDDAAFLTQMRTLACRLTRRANQ